MYDGILLSSSSLMLRGTSPTSPKSKSNPLLNGNYYNMLYIIALLTYLIILYNLLNNNIIYAKM